jgi:outer membrane protein OmpA-like peptidoglycan-associated protein
MRKICRLFALFGVLLGVSGCASYSNVVNSFAPEKQKSDIVVAADKTLQQSPAKSQLCAEPAPLPPPPPPPVREVYMVMPESGGKAGTVAVTFNDGHEVMLHGDYSAMSLAGENTKTYVSDRDEMQKIFGTAIAALPQAPLSVTLYFVLGKDEMTPESKLEAEGIFNEFVKHQVPEIVVVGHTDTVGSTADNDKLSIRRAEKVRQILIKMGVPAASIQAFGRGERDLLVKTPDKTPEPKNRRVEITVR